MRLNKHLAATILLLVAARSYGGEPSTTGLQHLTFTERSPLSAPDVVLKRLGRNSDPNGQASLGHYDLPSESFTVFVPANYNPKAPPGLLVWTGVSQFSSNWLGALSKRKLILVLADRGVGHATPYGLHLDAVYNMERLYTIDTNRVYVSGFSAGGSLAKYMICAFPDVFRGGLFVMGGYFYLSRNIGNGQREPTVEASGPMWSGPLDQIKQYTSLVIMKGGSDPEWTPQEGRSDYRALWLDGFTRVSYFEVPGLKHVLPDGSWFERAATALDQSTPLIPPVITPTREAQPLPGQIAQAQRILATGRYYLEQKAPRVSKVQVEKIGKSNRNKARKYFAQVIDEYPTTPAAASARALLDGLDQKEAIEGNKLVRPQAHQE